MSLKTTIRQNYRQTWGFYKAGVLGQLRSPSAVFFGFFFPLVFIMIFGFLSGNNGSQATLGLVRSSFEAYTPTKQAVENTKIFKIVEDNQSQLDYKLQKGQIDGYFEIQPDQSWLIKTSSSKPQQEAIIRQTFSTLADKKTIAESRMPAAANLKYMQIENRNIRLIDFTLPGLIGFSLLSSSVTGTSFSFLTLRSSQALKRLFATPAKSSNFILGQALSRMSFNLVQQIVLVLVAVVFFQFALPQGLVTLLQMLVVILLGLLAFLGIGYIVAGIVKSDDQAGPLSQIFVLPQVLLAGTFFPISNLPEWLQVISKSMPLYNFNESLRYISLNGLYLWSPEVVGQLSFLILWLIIIYFIASRVFRIR
jgi:ABC-2 type transport system permease protein